MRRRQPLNIREGCCRRILRHVEDQEIGDGQIVEPTRDFRMLPNAIEGITENNERTQMCIEERLDAELVPCAKQAPPARVPNGEGKIAKQVFDALIAPGVIRMKNKLDVRCC